MYAKVINPKTNGRVVYNNAGSSRRCTNYLVKEAKETGEAAVFFGAPGTEPRTADEVVAMLDGNVKGLGKDAVKFHSLVLSPSPDEQRQIEGDPRALERYTQKVMDLYAKNFTLKDGKQLGESDLVWAATIHHERTNRGTDPGVQGEKKEGLQTHVHVIVSARDAAQKITLNPLGLANRFNRVQFQAQAGAQMEIQFGRVGVLDAALPVMSRKELVAQKAAEITSKAAANKPEKKVLSPEQLAAKLALKDARLDVQVARINTKLLDGNKLDPERVKEVARERDYDNSFYFTLGKVERNAEKGHYVGDPYAYLSTGLVARIPEVLEGKRVNPNDYHTPIPAPRPEPEQSPMVQAMTRIMNKVARSLDPAGKGQDVRSDREREQEMQWEW